MIRGNIWLADFGLPFGSEAGFERPVLIIQNNDFNRSKINTIIVLPFTTNLNLEKAPGNIFISRHESGLSKDSVIVVSQVYAIDKLRLIKRISQIDKDIMIDVEMGLKLVLSLN